MPTMYDGMVWANFTVWANFYASQPKPVKKLFWLEIDDAHFNVEDSNYSYSVFESSSSVHS